MIFHVIIIIIKLIESLFNGRKWCPEGKNCNNELMVVLVHISLGLLNFKIKKGDNGVGLQIKWWW